ncbi:MAG: hypothetical protein FD167_6088 [bacterium]|nr:MAG: hypothetical protein FD167_6088 [bacterium]
MNEIIVTGLIKGNTILLDQHIPQFEGKQVSIKVESLTD